MPTAKQTAKWKRKIDKATAAADRDLLAEIVTAMSSATRDVTTAAQSDLWADWLGTASRMHRYSANNQMLIRAQDRNATLVAGESRWRQHGFEPVDRPARITVLAWIQTPKFRPDPDLSPADLVTVPPSGRRKAPQTVVHKDGKALKAFVGRNGDVMVEHGRGGTWRPERALDISQVRPVDGSGAAADKLLAGAGTADPEAALEAVIAHADTAGVHVDLVADIGGSAAPRTVDPDSRTVTVRLTDPSRTCLEVLAGVCELHVRDRTADRTPPVTRQAVTATATSAAFAAAKAVGLDTTGWALPTIGWFLTGVDTDAEDRAEVVKARMDAIYGDVVAVVRMIVPTLPAGHGGKLPFIARTGTTDTDTTDPDTDTTDTDAAGPRDTGTGVAAEPVGAAVPAELVAA